jgi:hypothetical protein
MKEIQLTQGQVALVDDEDFERVSQYKWRAQKANRVKRLKFYVVSGQSPSLILLHRLIVGAPKSAVVDHISGDGLDNRRGNLRLATHAQNMRNSATVLLTHNSSGFRGVSWCKNQNRWRTRLAVDGNLMHVGYFTDKLEAAKAYNEAAKKYHGEFATLNPIEGE